jgi:hypothetical protein
MKGCHLGSNVSCIVLHFGAGQGPDVLVKFFNTPIFESTKDGRCQTTVVLVVIVAIRLGRQPRGKSIFDLAIDNGKVAAAAAWELFPMMILGTLSATTTLGMNTHQNGGGILAVVGIVIVVVVIAVIVVGVLLVISIGRFRITIATSSVAAAHQEQMVAESSGEWSNGQY